MLLFSTTAVDSKKQKGQRYTTFTGMQDETHTP